MLVPSWVPSDHGKSPLNHHLGDIFVIVQPPNSRKSKVGIYALTVGSWDFSQARLTECNKALSAARDEWQQALTMRQIRPVQTMASAKGREGGRFTVIGGVII